MAASNSFNNNNQNSNFRIGINTREMTPNDISNVFYNANSHISSDVSAILSNENAPADWSVDLSTSLIQNPRRSLEGIIEERKQIIDRQVIDLPFGDQFERLKMELTAFVNAVVSSAAKLFATDSQPDSFVEAALR